MRIMPSVIPATFGSRKMCWSPLFHLTSNASSWKFQARSKWLEIQKESRKDSEAMSVLTSSILCCPTCVVSCMGETLESALMARTPVGFSGFSETGTLVDSSDNSSGLIWFLFFSKIILNNWVWQFCLLHYCLVTVWIFSSRLGKPSWKVDWRKPG